MLPKFLYVILKFRGGANGKMDAVRSYHSRKSFKQIRTCLKFHSNDHSNAGNFRLYTVNDGHSNDHSKDLSNDHSPCITGLIDFNKPYWKKSRDSIENFNCIFGYSVEYPKIQTNNQRFNWISNESIEYPKIQLNFRKCNWILKYAIEFPNITVNDNNADTVILVSVRVVQRGWLNCGEAWPPLLAMG